MQGDSVVADFHYFHHHPFQDGDPVVIFHDRSFLVKRIAALPGEKIEGRKNAIYLNGVLLHEQYAHHIFPEAEPQLENFGPVIVPAGDVFVLGDNRDISYDSRTPEFGIVRLNDIQGKLLYVVRNKLKKGRHGVPIL